eukprot:4429017-Lingulodinium_polyedra.AAC.1
MPFSWGGRIRGARRTLGGWREAGAGLGSVLRQACSTRLGKTQQRFAAAPVLELCRRQPGLNSQS